MWRFGSGLSECCFSILFLPKWQSKHNWREIIFHYYPIISSLSPDFGMKTIIGLAEWLRRARGKGNCRKCLPLHNSSCSSNMWVSPLTKNKIMFQKFTFPAIVPFPPQKSLANIIKGLPMSGKYIFLQMMLISCELTWTKRKPCFLLYFFKVGN